MLVNKNGFSNAPLFLSSIAAVASSIILAMPSFADLSWQQSLHSGLDSAKSQHKYVLADVYTDWCGWCKKLDADTFSDPKMQAFLSQNFVCVKVNAEDGGEGQKAAKENKVDGYPCALVFNAEGKLVGKVSGYQNAADYQKSLQNLMDKKN